MKRRTTRAKRAWNIGLVLVGLAWLAGCASLRLSEPRYSAEVITQDPAVCAANPRALPGCIVGVFVYVKALFQARR